MNYVKYFLISKYNVDLKILVQEVMSEHEFCGSFFCKFRKILGKTDFQEQVKKNVIHTKG